MGSEPITMRGPAVPPLPGAPAPGADASIEKLFEMTSDLLATISLDGCFTLLNPAWEQLLGWSREELRSRPVAEFVHPEDAEQLLGPMRAGEGFPTEVENFTTRYRHKDGSWHWLLWSARRDGGTWYAAAKDVTDRMWLESQALHDPLTRLPNRTLLMDRALQAMTRLHRSDGVLAMLFVDLDKFKAVNDNLGHDVGDRLLVSVAERLGELMRDSDTIARLGGDEFVILAEDLEDQAEALALAARILDALERPFPLGTADVAMLASVGVAVTKDPSTDPEAMLREADLAMYKAKGAGGRRLELFDDSLRKVLDTQVELETLLHDALPRKELILAYQPMMPLTGGRAVGIEALVRWHPQRDGTIEELLPGIFLPPAEDSELIVQIGRWVLHSACEQAERWRRAGINVPVSINVSARELTEREELTYCRLPGQALCIEVGEDAVMRDPERAREALKDVKRLGVSIALDKFGSRGLSLGLPRNIPLDVVKLDRELTGSFHLDKERRAIFAATIALAKEAGLRAIAVGIETNRQLALARQLDCSIGQGFLLHGPTGPDEVRIEDRSASVTSAPWRPTVRLSGKRS